jgi:hypothetical protein
MKPWIYLSLITVGPLVGMLTIAAFGELARSSFTVKAARADSPGVVEFDEPLCYLRMQDGRALDLQDLCGKAAPAPPAPSSPASPAAEAPDGATGSSSTPAPTPTANPTPMPTATPTATPSIREPEPVTPSPAPATAPKIVAPNPTYDDRRF